MDAEMVQGWVVCWAATYWLNWLDGIVSTWSLRNLVRRRGLSVSSGPKCRRGSVLVAGLLRGRPRFRGVSLGRVATTVLAESEHIC